VTVNGPPDADAQRSTGQPRRTGAVADRGIIGQGRLLDRYGPSRLGRAAVARPKDFAAGVGTAGGSTVRAWCGAWVRAPRTPCRV
jgi:hypothetical protein